MNSRKRGIGNFLEKVLNYFLIKGFFGFKASGPVGSLLAIILDSNPSQPIIRRNPDNLTKILDSVIALANIHLLQRSENQLVVLACHHHST